MALEIDVRASIVSGRVAESPRVLNQESCAQKCSFWSGNDPWFSCSTVINAVNCSRTVGRMKSWPPSYIVKKWSGHHTHCELPWHWDHCTNATLSQNGRTTEQLLSLPCWYCYHLNIASCPELWSFWDSLRIFRMVPLSIHGNFRRPLTKQGFWGKETAWRLLAEPVNIKYGRDGSRVVGQVSPRGGSG